MEHHSNCHCRECVPENHAPTRDSSFFWIVIAPLVVVALAVVVAILGTAR